MFQRALQQTFETYADGTGGIEQSRLVKHAVKAAGKLGVSGSKGERTTAFSDFLASARASGAMSLNDGVWHLNPEAQQQFTEAGPVAEDPSTAPAQPAAEQHVPVPEPAPQPVNGEPAQPPLKRRALAQGAAADEASKRGTLADIASMATEIAPAAGVGDVAAPSLASLVTDAPGPDFAKAPPLTLPEYPAAQPAAIPDAAAMGSVAALTPEQLGNAAVQADGMAAADAAAGTPQGVKRKPGRPRQEGSWASDRKRTDVKRGKFTTQEKETLRQSVMDFAKANGHSETDLSWLFKTRQTPGIYSANNGGAWQTIAQALPHRTTQQVWACGTRMLHPGNYKGKWTPEEDAQLRELVTAKGRRWLEIGQELGRMGEACRDRWRTIHQGDTRNTGTWSSEEAQKLDIIVKEHLAEKRRISQEGGVGKTVGRRVVLDDIDWGQIAIAHGTRNHAQCMERWYKCQAPSMVERGDWDKGDDRRMLKFLFTSGATQEWEVDWENAVPGRNAQTARRRWQLMLKDVPDWADKEFGDCLDFLVDTYAKWLKDPSILRPPDTPHAVLPADHAADHQQHEAAAAAAADQHTAEMQQHAGPAPDAAAAVDIPLPLPEQAV